MLSVNYDPQNAIQKAVDKALDSIGENTQDVTIQVEAGEYNGDIKIKKANVATGFTLKLVAKDATAIKDTDGKTIGWNADSEGKANVKGDIIIEGINVFLAGLYLDLEKKITVKEADLTVVGTTQDDTYTIEGDGVGNLTVNTGEGDDTVSAKLINETTGDVTVSTGIGDDTVSVDLYKAQGTVTVDAGISDEEMAAAEQAARDAAAQETAAQQAASGDTTITVEPELPTDNDTVDVKVTEASKEVTIDTGAGDDTVELKTKRTSKDVTINTGSGDDSVTLTKVGKAATSAVSAVRKDITVNLGEGSDEVNLDITVADVYNKLTIIQAADTVDPETNTTNKNEYSLHLSGALKANPAENEDVITSSADMKTFTVKNSGNNQMTIDMTGTTVANRSLSEELTNKPVVEIDLSKYSTATDDDDKDSRLVRSEDGKTVTFKDNKVRLFTDYQLTGKGADDFSEIVINGSENLLNNLVIGKDVRSTQDGKDEGKLVLNKLTVTNMNVEISDDDIVLKDVIDARDTDLTIKGEIIDVYSVLAAQNVKIEAFAGKEIEEEEEENEDEEAEEEEDDGDNEGSEDGSRFSLTDIADVFQSMTADFFNVNHHVEINIHEDAGIYAADSVELSAIVNQNGGMLDITKITDALNLINVKVGTAKINVDGKIYAGVDLSDNDQGKAPWEAEGEPETDGGSISMTTNVMSEIEAGSSNKYLSSLAVSVAVVNSEININEGAVLKSGGDISAISKGNVKVTTHASAGSLPISLAISAVVTDVHTIVDGATITTGPKTITEPGGNVKLEAEGILTVNTSSDKSEENSSNSGGFFAIDVVVQDVEAKVLNSTAINAGGDVDIHSTAKANVTTKAVSAMAAGDDDDGGDGDGTTEGDGNTEGYGADGDGGEGEGEGADNSPSTLDSVKNIAVLLLGNILTAAGRPDLDEKLTAGLRTAQYNVTLSITHDDTKGQVTLSRNKANAGSQIVVSAAPKEGYVVDSITLRTLEPGRNTYTDGTTNYATSAYHTGVRTGGRSGPGRPVRRGR